MSSVHLFRVGEIWHYRFQVAGARMQKSTRYKSRKAAEKVAERAFEKAKLWAQGLEPTGTLRQLVVDWLAVSDRTVSAHYWNSVETFGRLHLYDLADLELDQLTTTAVEKARRDHLADHARASANHWLTILKMLCRWAKRTKRLGAIPWEVTALKVQKRPRVTLPIGSASAWLGAVDAVTVGRGGVSLAVRLMFGLGLREVECITARWEWLDWERRTYTPGQTKGREADPIPLPAWLYDALAAVRKPAGLIVVKPSGQPYARGFTRQAMRAANEALDLGRLTPHRLRGTFATLMSEAGVPIQTIQRVMRHKDHKTTMAYLEVNLATAARGQDAIADRAGLAG